jgi:hypothetical protein
VLDFDMSKNKKNGREEERGKEVRGRGEKEGKKERKEERRGYGI